MAVAVFVALAYGGAWALLMPFIQGGADLADPTASPGAYVATIAMMFTPAASALVTAAVIERRRGAALLEAMGLRGLFTRRAWKVGLWSMLGAAVLVAGSWGIGLLLGWIHLDPEQSAAKALLVRFTGEEPPMPMAALAALQLVNIPFGLAITGIAVAGEEMGWRGWLLPRLLPLGRRWALPLSGAIWGLWHAPAILLGLNYEQRDIVGIIMMLVACTGLGTIIGWIRLQSASLLPCVLAHAALNVFAAYQSVLFPPFDQRLVGPLSLTGWVLLATALVTIALVDRRHRSASYRRPI